MRVDHEKESDGGELTMRKRAIRVDHVKESNAVRVHHKRKSDVGVRVDHEKDRWGESSPLERAMK